MTLKEFGEKAEISVQVIINVNDELAFEMEYADLDLAFDDYRNMNKAIGYTLESQYEDLAEETIEN